MLQRYLMIALASRVMRGIYVFNPGLVLKVESNWINIYDLLAIDKPVN
ncbi:MAG: hypothetical protein KF888_00040 [Nitrosomonas sp.]|nr:hypothetical protein [Nitrosomonas sp.]